MSLKTERQVAEDIVKEILENLFQNFEYDGSAPHMYAKMQELTVTETEEQRIQSQANVQKGMIKPVLLVFSKEHYALEFRCGDVVLVTLVLGIDFSDMTSPTVHTKIFNTSSRVKPQVERTGMGFDLRNGCPYVENYFPVTDITQPNLYGYAITSIADSSIYAMLEPIYRAVNDETVTSDIKVVDYEL